MSPDDDALGRTVDDLYGLDPDAFITARGQAAAALRAAGDKAAAAVVTKLTKPTVAAWAVNQLVRANPELVRRLADLGVRLRAAQSTLDAAELKALRPDRDALLDEAVHATASVAAARGHALAAAAADVRATFIAALADPAATDALVSGRLVRPLSYAGFGEVQLDDAVATLPSPAASSVSASTSAPATTSTSRPAAEPPRPNRTSKDRDDKGKDDDRARRAARDQATRAAEHAHTALRDAEREATAAELAAAEAASRLRAARDRTEEIRTLLASAEADERAAKHLAAAATADRAAAHTRVAAATTGWEAAKAARDKLA